MNYNNIYWEFNNIISNEVEEKIHVVVKIPISIGWIDDVKLYFNNRYSNYSFPLKHEKNDSNYAYFSANISLKTSAFYNYRFSFKVNNTIYYNDNNKYSVNFEVPDWAKGEIMYHIFVDRFKKIDNNNLIPMKNRIIHTFWKKDVNVGPDKNGIWNNDFYGGNLKGIESSLEYIKSLGVSIIYLSPIVLSQSNHRYDTADYSVVDPYAGTNDDLKHLCDKAHNMGMKVILDAVFNHTGNDSKYFNEFGNYNDLGAFQSDKSMYHSFYRKHFFNNKTYFDYWWGMKNLPVCDTNSVEWQRYICGVNGIIDLWFSLGIDGLRLDVADELSDDFIYKVREAVKRNKKDGFILGEVWKNPMRMNRGYLDSGYGMDSVMNYPLVDALIRYYKYSDVYKLNDILKQIIVEYPDDTICSLMNFTSTHDISRAINIFSADEFNKYGEWAWDIYNSDYNWQKKYTLSKKQYDKGLQMYKAYVFTLAFLPGNLSIFYGDEVGLEGMGNLANRRPFPWNNINKELLSFFRNIGMLRNNEEYLRKAKLNIIDINNKYFMFERDSSDVKSLITVNRTNDSLNINYPGNYNNYSGFYSLNDSHVKELKPYGGLVLKKIKK